MTVPRVGLDALLKKGSRSGGYTRVPNILLRRGSELGLTRSSLLVLVVLLSFRRGDTACVSVVRISRDSTLSERTVKTCLAKLERSGLLRAVRDTWRHGRRHTNTYDLTFLAERLEKSLSENPWKKHAPQASLAPEQATPTATQSQGTNP